MSLIKEIGCTVIRRSVLPIGKIVYGTTSPPILSFIAAQVLTSIYTQMKSQPDYV